MDDFETVYAVRGGVVFLVVGAVFWLIFGVECIWHPFLYWRAGLEYYAQAVYDMLVYALFLSCVAVVCSYFGVRLIWRGWNLRKSQV